MKQSMVAVLVGARVFGVGLQVGVTMFSSNSGASSAEASPTSNVTDTTAHTHVTTTDAGAPVDDKGLALLSNGHHHAIGAEKPLSSDDRLLLSQQIGATIEVAKRLPTVADAEAAGYRRAGPWTASLWPRPTGSSATPRPRPGSSSPSPDHQ